MHINQVFSYSKILQSSTLFFILNVLLKNNLRQIKQKQRISKLAYRMQTKDSFIIKLSNLAIIYFLELFANKSYVNVIKVL